MSKDKNQRLKEKEKLDSELARSLSVVEVKKAHKQIEDIEKLRKSSAIKSIIERISKLQELVTSLTESLFGIHKDSPEMSFNLKVSEGDLIHSIGDQIRSTYLSIRFDIEKNIGVNKQDFDKMLPTIALKFRTYSSSERTLLCLRHHLEDIKSFCQRLV